MTINTKKSGNCSNQHAVAADVDNMLWWRRRRTGAWQTLCARKRRDRVCNFFFAGTLNNGEVGEMLRLTSLVEEGSIPRLLPSAIGGGEKMPPVMYWARGIGNWAGASTSHARRFFFRSGASPYEDEVACAERSVSQSIGSASLTWFTALIRAATALRFVGGGVDVISPVITFMYSGRPSFFPTTQFWPNHWSAMSQICSLVSTDCPLQLFCAGCFAYWCVQVQCSLYPVTRVSFRFPVS